MRTEFIWVGIWLGDGSLKRLMLVPLPCDPPAINEIVREGKGLT